MVDHDAFLLNPETPQAVPAFKQAQKAAQSAHVRDCQDSPKTLKTLENKGFEQILTTVVSSLQMQGIPPRGLEPLS